MMVAGRTEGLIEIILFPALFVVVLVAIRFLSPARSDESGTEAAAREKSQTTAAGCLAYLLLGGIALWWAFGR